MSRTLQSFCGRSFSRVLVLAAVCLVVAAGLALPAGAYADSTGTISGYVLQANGLNASNITVTLLAAGGGATQATATSGTDGSYSFTQVPAGSYTVMYGGSGYQTCYYHDQRTLAAADTVTVSAGATTTLDTEMMGWTDFLCGTVTSPQGYPMPDAIVAISGPGGLYIAAADNWGHYSYPLSYDPYDPTFRGFKVYAYWDDVGYSAFTTVGANGESISPCDLAVRDVGWVTGSVVDPRGLPPTQVTVTLSDGQGNSYTTTTSAKGDYWVYQVPPGTYTVTYSGSGYQTSYYHDQRSLAAADTVTVSAGATTTLDTEMMGWTGFLCGTVTSPQGYPMGAALVMISGPSGSYSAQADNWGRYFYPLSYDPYDPTFRGFKVYAFWDGWGYSAFTTVGANGESISPCDLSLQDVGWVTGKVVGADGDPLPPGAKVAVTLSDGQGNSYTATASAEGVFCVYQVPPGTYTATYGGSGYQTCYYHDQGSQDAAETITVKAGETTTLDDQTLLSADTTPPTVSISPSPSPDTNASSVTLSWSGSDDVALAAAPYDYALSRGSTIVDSTSGVGATSVTEGSASAPLPEGDYTFSVTATDAAGNVSTPATCSFTVDRTPPQLGLTRVEVTAAGALTPVDLPPAATDSHDGAVPISYSVASAPLSGPPCLFDLGSTTVTATAGDAAGNQATQSFVVQVDPIPVTVAADPQTKVYGGADPALTYQITSGHLLAGDNFSGSLARDAGESVGSYAISQHSLALPDYYALSYMTSDLSITPATLTVAANDATKTYGDSDPTLTYGLSGFVNGEDATSAQVSGAPDLARGGGEKVGGYAISVQDTGSLSAPNYAFQASATPADFTITPAPLTISANNQSKAFGKTLTLTGTEFTTSPAKLYASGDSVTSVTLTCSTNSGGTSGTAANAALGTYTLTPSAAVGTGISNYRISYASGTLTVAPAPTTITLTASPTQCGETSTFTASVSPATAGGQTLTGTVQFAVNGAKVGSPVAIDAGGVATCSYTANLAAGSYPVTATFAAGTTAADSNFANPTSPASTNLAVSQKNATIAYSGDTLGVAGSALNLQATAMDSSAAGYGGANPQPNTKPGDITKMWIAFVITPVGGATSSTVYAPVLDTGVAGDGIGTASATFKATSQSSYNVVASLVAGSGGGTNLYYSALDAQPASLTFYTGSGQFATGGGWLKDPTTGTRGNFGLLAGYTPVGKPMGLFSYCWCGTYNGVPAFFTISASNITALGFSGAKYPLSATLSGTATLTVTKATNCGLLYGPETNLPISVTACDTGQSSGVGVDKLSLTLTGSKAPFLAGGMKSFTGLVLGGGNVVIHLR